MSLHLASLADLLGDAESAQEHARDALDSAITVASPVFEAKALLILARLAHRRSRRDRPGRSAREYAAAARRIAERLEWSTFLAQIDEVVAADRRGGLSGREHEIAVRIAEGLSNRQIAALLYLSERTVETHVRHILSKLDVASRVDVAMWVAAHRDGARRA